MEAKRSGVYPRVYDQAVLDALIPVWEAFNRQCGKLFAPFLHANVDSIVSEPAFHCCEEVIKKLGKISASTVDRLLKPRKAVLNIKGTGGTKPAANHALAAWCKQQGIALTRSRGSRKNDNCYVEQKNGASVRKIVGYARFCGDKGIAAL
jgi:hypothetical protein